MLAVCSWCLTSAPALVWVQYLATSCSPWGHWEAEQRWTLHIPIPMRTNRMCLAQCSVALKMGEKLVFYFVACVHLCLGSPGWKSASQGEQSLPEFTNSVWLNVCNDVLILQGVVSPATLCRREIVTMLTLWWPFPLLGHCALADAKEFLRCRYFFSFASDLMWPSPCMIASHGFAPLLYFRESSCLLPFPFSPRMFRQ